MSEEFIAIEQMLARAPFSPPQRLGTGRAHPTAGLTTARRTFHSCSTRCGPTRLTIMTI
jgi:hypothetical protein